MRAVELCNDVLARINETENKIGAYVTVAEESAKENAKKIDKSNGAGRKSFIRLQVFL